MTEFEKCCGRDIVTQGGICVDCPYLQNVGMANLLLRNAQCEDLAPDPINHPPHYTQHPSGVECITITEHYNFNVGNAIKYLWRAGLKDGTDAASDLRKAAWYVRGRLSGWQGPY